jgi:NADPH-dependent glutamate synthase beta subunit-like oxidoreductase/NAD-dependent dihydropyrimidine dehydrogenase PreA subunit
LEVDIMSIELVNRELCNGCGICVTTCPLDVIRLDTAVTDQEEYPNCRRACPAGVDIRSYFYLLKNGMVKEAIDILREALPFPAVTGRVCPHPCESECSRKEVDEAVNINALERFVADYWLKEKAKPALKIYAAKVAIIGSGPAGLACAYFLSRMGYPVTIFEAMPVVGGMLRLSMPEYRLPKDVLDAQIDYIRDMGVEFKTGITIGKDIALEAIRKDYSAIFYATGNQLSRKVEISGTELDGVLWGLDFLVGVNHKRRIKVKDSVVVIGGGNVAMDVALTALRSGAKKVELACLESAEKMPAFKEEINQAVDEGVSIHAGWGPRKIIGDSGKVTGIELIRCESIFDKEGRFSPCYDDKVAKTIKADMIILAIGQAADLSLIPKDLKITKGGTVQVDPITLETTLPGIFAGGDIVSGPASVVEAIAAGKRASVSIDRYLKKEDLKAGRYLRPKRVKKPPKEGIEKIARNLTSLLPTSQRAGNFKEVKMGFNEDTANMEVQRCMTCGSRAIINYVEDCMLCLYCERDCPQKAIFVSPEKKVMPLVPWA